MVSRSWGGLFRGSVGPWVRGRGYFFVGCSGVLRAHRHRRANRANRRFVLGLDTKSFGGRLVVVLVALVLPVVEVHRFKHKNGFAVVGLLFITSISPTSSRSTQV
jgi:hypothetical protein